ncbi:hypothetical protein ACOMHN_053312 [Nucella lapillus]
MTTQTRRHASETEPILMLFMEQDCTVKLCSLSPPPPIMPKVTLDTPSTMSDNMNRLTETARDISAAKWRCEEDPQHVSYQSAENDDSVADQRSDGSSHHTDDQTDDDKTGSDNAGLCYTDEECPAVTNRDSEMTTTSAIEEPEVMSGATTCCEEVIAAPQTAASGTDTETKAKKKTKDGNKGKKTEADENRRTHNADEERVPPNTPPTPLNSKPTPSAASGDSPPTQDSVTFDTFVNNVNAQLAVGNSPSHRCRETQSRQKRTCKANQ